MVTKLTKTIALILPDIANPFFAELARGVEDRARESAYTAILCNSDNDIRKEESYLMMLESKMVDGIVYASSSNRSQLNDCFQSIKLPLVTVDRSLNGNSKYGKIIVDNVQGAFDAVSYMLSRKLHKIAYITGPFTSKTAVERLRGYQMALKSNGIEYNSELVFEGNFNSAWGQLAMEKILKNNVAVDAVFCGNDMIAAGVYKTIRRNNYHIPDDFSVVGFDDVEIAQLLTPELTTVSQPKYQIGYKAAEVLLQLIAKQEIEQYEYIFDTELIVRESVK